MAIINLHCPKRYFIMLEAMAYLPGSIHLSASKNSPLLTCQGAFYSDRSEGSERVRNLYNNNNEKAQQTFRSDTFQSRMREFGGSFAHVT